MRHNVLALISAGGQSRRWGGWSKTIVFLNSGLGSSGTEVKGKRPCLASLVVSVLLLFSHFQYRDI